MNWGGGNDVAYVARAGVLAVDQACNANILTHTRLKKKEPLTAPGLGCTTTSQTDPPLKLAPVGCQLATVLDSFGA